MLWPRKIVDGWMDAWSAALPFNYNLSNIWNYKKILIVLDQAQNLVICD